MTHIKIDKGLNIPIAGQPEGIIKTFPPHTFSTPQLFGLDLTPFSSVKFRLLVKEGELVQIGQPLVEDKKVPGRFFVSPAAGIIQGLQRGHKRVLLSLSILAAEQETYFQHPVVDINIATATEIITVLKQAGLFASIYARPLGLLADPEKPPGHIFVKALESAPFTPPAELQVEGFEKEFQHGLNALQKLCAGNVHLVHRLNTSCRAFSEALHVHRHTAEGPHPIANASIHIQKIAPIRRIQDIVWTINARDVVCLGHLLLTGQVLTRKVISIAGPGILPGKIGYFSVRTGASVENLIHSRLIEGPVRIISGDPLMGHRVEKAGFLGYHDSVLCAIPENVTREFLHFFRLGTNKYSFSRAYLSGHLTETSRQYSFTTNQHGEHRAFVDATMYDKVQPLPISTMLLVKAIMAEDYELAERLGILEVHAEDFALPTFVCPSKMEMTSIVERGLSHYAKEVLA